MCRIFGFRSVIKSQVHHSLLEADNALHTQSQRHPDGWGVTYYINGSPHIVKSEKTALEDGLFKKVSGVASSETVLAHIRNATKGDLNILNTHPFQYGSWVFAHNGNVKNFANKKDDLLKLISAELRRFILGDTDSEVIFYIFLTSLARLTKLNDKCNIQTLIQACSTAVEEIVDIIGPLHESDKGPTDENYLTFVMTNGETMIAHHGGKDLYYSTYKKKCGESSTCPSYGYECENSTKTGLVNHLIFSSEPLSGENIWLPFRYRQFIGVDSQMKIELS